MPFPILKPRPKHNVTRLIGKPTKIEYSVFMSNLIEIKNIIIEISINKIKPTFLLLLRLLCLI